jgi:hypothetical protein
MFRDIRMDRHMHLTEVLKCIQDKNGQTHAFKKKVLKCIQGICTFECKTLINIPVKGVYEIKETPALRFS